MSWTETKWALNRSLGMSDFMPLDEKIEKTQEMILPAGMGDFSRTALEYSPEQSFTTNEKILYFNYLKFILPETGAYKFSFTWKNSTEKMYSVLKLGYRIQTFINSPYPLKSYYDFVNMKISNTEESYSDFHLVEELKKTTKKSTTFVNEEMYFYAIKGIPCIMQGLVQISDEPSKIATFTIKNFKVTY